MSARGSALGRPRRGNLGRGGFACIEAAKSRSMIEMIFQKRPELASGRSRAERVLPKDSRLARRSQLVLPPHRARTTSSGKKYPMNASSVCNNRRNHVRTTCCGRCANRHPTNVKTQPSRRRPIFHWRNCRPPFRPAPAGRILFCRRPAGGGGCNALKPLKSSPYDRLARRPLVTSTQVPVFKISHGKRLHATLPTIDAACYLGSFGNPLWRTDHASARASRARHLVFVPHGPLALSTVSCPSNWR